MVILVQYTRKVTVVFTSNKSINAVNNMMSNQLEGKIDTAIETEFNIDITGLVIEHCNRAIESVNVNNQFEIYPKTFISGDFDGTIEEFDLRVDNILDSFKTIVGDEVNAFGGTIRPVNGWHIHRPTGNGDEN